jgi:hypothetical protein
MDAARILNDQYISPLPYIPSSGRRAPRRGSTLKVELCCHDKLFQPSSVPGIVVHVPGTGQSPVAPLLWFIRSELAADSGMRAQ